MKALRKICAGPGLELQNVGAPCLLGPDEVLLRVCSAGICGTDLHIEKWTPNYHFMASSLPVTVGHEFSGVVSAVGVSVEGLAINTLVAVRPSVVCGTCASCLAHNPDSCTQRCGIGLMRDGGFAPWVAVPARNCLPVPAGLDAEIVAMAEPLTVSYEAVCVSGAKRGDRVLVLGPGHIGQGVALFAREIGAAEVIVAGHSDPDRLAILQRMGFTEVVDFAEHGIAGGLAPYLKQGKFDVIIEATGAAAVVEPALQALKLRGTLVITGIHSNPVPIDLTALVRNHHTMCGSYRAAERNWSEVLAFMRREQSILRHMITHRVPLSGVQEGLALASSRKATKVLVQPD